MLMITVQLQGSISPELTEMSKINQFKKLVFLTVYQYS
jgi:hypothetical protein